tara:strand:+ start:385 stop:639 length:255 start_codon:yes stop_codon:yes gene_type:complete
VQDTVEALRNIPYVNDVHVLSEENEHPEIKFKSIQEMMLNRKRLSLIGKKGCAIFFSNKSSILMIKSDANVNLGAIDLILDSIK